MARGNDHFTFYHTGEKSGRESFPEITKVPSVVVLRDFDEKKLIYTGELDNNLELYLKKRTYPLVGEWNEESADLVFAKAQKKGVILIIDQKADPKILKEFTAFAERKKDEEHLFLNADPESHEGMNLLTFLGLEKKELPRFEILHVDGQVSRYLYKGRWEREEMMKFYEDVKKENIPRFFRSEEIPKNNPGPVFRVVGKNFKEEIIDNYQDVFVNFFSELCEKCKEVEPIYKAVAEKLKDFDSLKIVDINMNKNDFDGQAVSSFPTFRLYTATDKKNPIEYTGPRTEADMISFLKAKCTHKLIEQKTDL